MNAFSQLNGQASLPHGGRSGLSAGWSGEAFSQLNAPRDSALVCGRSPIFATAPFSQLNGHAAQVPGGQVSPRIGRVGSAFSQLNAWGVCGHPKHATKHSTSAVTQGSRVFSQLNARGHAPLGQARKNVFARAAFSQLNALGLVASSTCCSAHRSRPNPVPHRPDFSRPLKKCSSNAPGSWISKKRIAQTGLRSDWSGHFGLFAGRFARSGRTYPMVHA